MPPGPGLAMLLASVDRSAVTADDLPDLVRARARLVAFEQAEFLLDLVEAVHGAAAEPGSTRRYVDGPLTDDAAVELGWALHWSPSWTAAQIDLAEALVGRLPMVFDALRSGRIDRERAFAFVDSLRFVEPEVARSVAAKLVDRAARWTLGQLRDKLRYHIDRADPGAQRRRYRRAVAERGVWLRGNDDGTSNLSGVNLAPHRAAAAFDRIDRLARAARRDGDGRNLSQLRADAFTDLLSGVPFQLAPSTDPITAEADAQHPLEEAEVFPPGKPQRRKPRPTTEPRTPRGHSGDPGGASADPGGAEPDGASPACTWGEPGGAEPGGAEPGGAEPGGAEPPGWIDLYDYDELCLTDEDRWWLSRLPADGPVAGSTEGPGTGACRGQATADLGLGGFGGAPLPGDRCVCGGLLPPRRPSSASVQVKLTTLLGRDEHPALITGLGPVPADIAGLVALDREVDPVWRWSVYGEDGQLRHHGYTNHRPTTMDSAHPAPARSETTNHTPGGAEGHTSERWCRCGRYEAGERRGVVELQLSTSTLAELIAHPHTAAGYELVIADIARQVAWDAQHNPPHKWSEVDDDGRLRHHGHTGRHPDAAEAAFIRARDRSCRTPNCRTPATKSEIDHRIEHARGGPSHRGNCECRCKRHHGIRHRTGFAIARRDRTTIWTTRNGRTYEVPPDKDITLTTEDS